MRKLMVGLMAVGLLAATAPAMAQIPGSQDSLQLITSGAVIPFLGSGLANGGQSWLELYAPVQGTNVHMFLYNAACSRVGPSVNVDLSENDVAIQRMDNIGGGPTSGLIALASTNDKKTLNTLSSAVTARVLWFSPTGNFVRTLDPIAISTLDNDQFSGTGTWSPLRTGAAFAAPRADGTFATTLYFVCPNTNITNHNSPTSGAFRESVGFPTLFPTPQIAGTDTPLDVFIYDQDETFLRDQTLKCNCLTTTNVTDIDPLYHDIDTYTEVRGGTQGAVPAVCSLTDTVPAPSPGVKNPGNPCGFFDAGQTSQFKVTTPAIPASGPFSFVMYRAITLPGLDIFGRMPGMSHCALDGDPSFCSNTSGR